MVGFCHLTDSHHYHHGQKPTMVGICHGGNMLGNHDGGINNDDDDEDDDINDDDDGDDDELLCGRRLVDWKKLNLFCFVAISLGW